MINKPNVLVRGVMVAASVVLLGACNAIFGIEERELAAADPLTCEAYCAAILDPAACPKDGPDAQYQSEAVCLATCAFFPKGTIEDETGNTLGCRLNNAIHAADTGEREDHCPLAGPLGCDETDPCTPFCAIATATCSEQSAGFLDEAHCLAFCRGTERNSSWTVSDPFMLDREASLECRVWHLTNAIIAPGQHCVHADGTQKCNEPIP